MNAEDVPEIVDDITAPEIFTDGALSFFVFNGVVRIVLGSVRSTQSLTGPGNPRQVVSGRLAMSIPAAQTLAIGLFDFLKNQGLDPSAAVKGDATPQ